MDSVAGVELSPDYIRDTHKIMGELVLLLGGIRDDARRDVIERAVARLGELSGVASEIARPFPR